MKTTGMKVEKNLVSLQPQKQVATSLFTAMRFLFSII